MKPITTLLTLALTMTVSGALAQEPKPDAGHSHHATKEKSPTNLPRDLTTPQEWKVRLDKPADGPVLGNDPDTTGIYFVNMPPGWHVRTGPAAILFDPASTASGNFRIESTFYLFDPGERREAYGIFFGGSDLEGADQAYDYFVIRNSGEYLIKRRRGEKTEVLAPWKADPSVVRYDGSGTSAENTLAVDAGAEVVDFYVNGKKVHSLPRAEVSADGLMGLRVNHALNLHVSKLDVAKK